MDRVMRRLWTWIEEAERRLRHSFGTEITTAKGRFWSKVHYNLFDHAFLRSFWTNFWPVAPGVWRSNQPTHRRFERYAAMGIRTVINLRGPDKHAHYLFEQESCDQLGLTLVNSKLWARTAAPRKAVVAVIDVLRAAERPVMFHCKSGADRAGFVAALYLMVFENRPVAEARKQLGLKYLHSARTATGVQDYILDVFEARQSLGEIGFEAWVRSEYSSVPLTEGFRNRAPAAKVAETLRNQAEAAS